MVEHAEAFFARCAEDAALRAMGATSAHLLSAGKLDPNLSLYGDALREFEAANEDIKLMEKFGNIGNNKVL